MIFLFQVLIGIPLSFIELPLLEAVNQLLDACSHYSTESQLTHIEVCIQHVEEAVVLWTHDSIG